MVSGSFLEGVLVGGVAIAVAPFLWRKIRSTHSRRGVFAAVIVAVFALSAVLMYRVIGSRHSLADTVAPVAVTPGVTGPMSNSGAPESMDAAVAKLEARLMRDGGSDSDWTLLAQAYDFLGRADDARRARAKLVRAPSVAQLTPAALSAMATQLDGTHPAAPAAGATAPPPGAPVAELEEQTRTRPSDAAAWLALADARRVERDFDGARSAYEKVIALKAMNAQSFADYADTLASLNGGSLSGAAGNAIDAALALDANNTKALWLKASQAHEEHRFSNALTWWGKLRRLLPADSSDARIIDGNIAEDSALAGGGASVAVPTKTGALAVQLTGTVSLDSRFAGRVPESATLFVYAKAADAPGPPLAVWRTRANTWPVSFRLDDSMSMIPSRKLSQFDKVIVEARISQSGNAAPSSGDLYVTSAVLNPAASQKLALVINREIG